MDMILASNTLNDIRVLDDADINMVIGDTDDFEMTINREDVRDDIAPFNAIYIPGTEYGGFLGEFGSDTSLDTYTINGRTWRGMLKDKIIEPPSGQAYRVISGELNDILKQLIEPEFPGIFYVSTEDTGVSVSNFQFDRYATLYRGLEKMLLSKEYRLSLAYVQSERGAPGYIEISAVPITDYSEMIELSQDSQVNFVFTDKRNGVNHLICLGKGELTEREVEHLYVQADGSIGEAQYYMGSREVTQIYENTSAETTEDLIEGGKERLMELMDYKSFSMDVSALGIDIDIGDIVGGRDYVSGFSIKRPIAKKTINIENGITSIEYEVKGDDEEDEADIQ